LQLLKEKGINPYPTQSQRTISVEDFLKGFNESSDKKETVSGRILSIRGQGGILFADIFDGTGRMQFVLDKSEIGDDAFGLFESTVDQGDFVEGEGKAYLTKRGQQSLRLSAWRMLSKSLMPLPTEWYGLKDPELKLRQRYLDLLLDENLRGMVERRAKFWGAMRSFLLERGFLEVETPVLENSPGGADARPFITRHNALDMEVYLRISAGELWQKRLLVAGFPKVFEIARIFRNEGQSREHLQDYTQLETYEAYSDTDKGKEFVQALYRHIVQEVYGKTSFEINGHSVDFAADWPTLDFCDLMQKEYGIDPLAYDASTAREVDEKWKLLRKTISGPAFLVGVPLYLSPLAKSTSDGRKSDRLQILIGGSEVGNGYSELNDPLDQRRRFEEQERLRSKGDEEAQRLDEEFIEALEFGMPPAFGFGVSERLFAFLENKPAHETQLFPLLRPKK
jgi:lysyl-tRNA synthetase class 2